jgi:hypothetical protein
MKNGLKLSCAVLLVGFMQSPVVRAMDDGAPAEQLSQFEQLLPEVLLHILSFVVESDPNAVGNLMKIQTVSKTLKGILPDMQINWIAGLTQEKVKVLLIDAINNLNAKKMQLWVRFGAQLDEREAAIYLYQILDDVYKRSTELNVDVDRSAVPPKYQEKNVLEMVKIVLAFGVGSMNTHVRGGPENDILGWSPLWVPTLMGWNEVVKYMLDSKIPIHKIAVEYAVSMDHTEIVQLFLDRGMDPNILIQKIRRYYQHTITPFRTPLYYVKSAQMARILLDRGARLYVDCKPKEDPNVTVSEAYRIPKSWSPTFSDIVRNARQVRNPSIIIAVLTKNYSLEAATAIALALMAGASLAGMTCTIL